MRYPLKKIPYGKGWLLSPYIPIKITNPLTGDSFSTDALVDSGASRNLCSEKIAKILGIDDIRDTEISKGEAFTTITGSKMKAYPHRVTIELEKNCKRSIVVFFSSDIPEEVLILGMHGFFDHFKVTIDTRHEVIVVTPFKPR
ncbi:MAG: retropepsin-like aspartic protease [Elusimicrobiota bacterium]